MEPADDAPPSHPVNHLIESLLGACRRGVRVRLVLNTKFRYRPKTEVGQGTYFERLITEGAELAALLPAKRLHDKLIVIDGRYVVEGSTNWSAAALESNYESASVIDSPAHARKKLERITRLTLPPAPKEQARDLALVPVPQSVRIPAALLEKGLLPKMIATSDARLMDLYLILLGQASASGGSELTLDLETAGRALALPANWDRPRARRQVIKVLKKLANRYGLLDVEFPYAKDAKIRLKELGGDTIEVPGRLLESGHLAQESSGAVFLKLAREVLKKEGLNLDSLSAPELEKRFGVGRSAVVRARRAQPSKTK